MKTLFTLALILLLPASFLAKAEDEKTAKRKANRALKKAAEKEDAK